MDLSSFVSGFLSSEHGQGAMSALTAQGIDPASAEQYLTHAAAAGHAHVEQHGSGLLGDNVGKSFFAAFAAGLVKGDGIKGALLDGIDGVLVGRVTEALAERAGLDPNTAATVAAAATPYVVAFVKSKL